MSLSLAWRLGPLLVAIAFAGAAPMACQADLASDLAQNLGLAGNQTLWDHAAAWGDEVQVSRQLHGSGFHRSLALAVRGTLQAAHRPDSSASCSAILAQPLPSDLFADPYQLADLQSSGETYELLGELDLELPAPVCAPTLLLIRQQLDLHADGSFASHPLELPLHAKYPAPLAAGLQGWRWLLSAHSHVLVPAPWLLLSCPHFRSSPAGGAPYAAGRDGAWLLLMPPPLLPEGPEAHGAPAPAPQGDQSALGDAHAAERAGRGAPPPLLWSVPAGNLDQLQLVAWGTGLAALAGSVAVARSAARFARHHQD